MNDRRASLTACLVVLLCRIPAPGAEPDGLVTIVAPDKLPVIVAPAAMEDQVKDAVEDLRHYLGKITGLKVELAPSDTAGKFAIYVGDVAANADLRPIIEREQLGREGFVLDVSPKGVRILGGGKFGTAYGVYELLERLGVRWLFPGTWGEVVPQNATLSLPAGRVTDKPGFLFRRMAVNYSYDPRLYMYDRKEYPQVSALSSVAARAATDEIGAWKRRNRQNTSGFFGHSNLISTKQYGRDHPEWFAQIDGKRQLDPENWKLCHSNEAMVQQALRDVLADIKKRKALTKPQIDDGLKHLQADYFIISVSPTDGGGFCRCDQCQKMGSISDRLQIFANTIADGVRKEFPDYWVGYYGDVLWDTFTHFQAGHITPEELRTAIRLSKSVDFSVTPLAAFMFARMPGAPKEELAPFTADELRQFLDQIVLPEPGEELSSWSDRDDLRLVPPASKTEAVALDMGANFRYAPRPCSSMPAPPNGSRSRRKANSHVPSLNCTARNRRCSRKAPPRRKSSSTNWRRPTASIPWCFPRGPRCRGFASRISRRSSRPAARCRTCSRTAMQSSIFTCPRERAGSRSFPGLKAN